MKKLILIGIIILLSGCSAKSYTKTTVYYDKNITKQYQSLDLFGGSRSNNYYPYCNEDDNCGPDGMYIQDDIGW